MPLQSCNTYLKKMQNIKNCSFTDLHIYFELHLLYCLIIIKLFIVGHQFIHSSAYFPFKTHLSESWVLFGWDLKVCCSLSVDPLSTHMGTGRWCQHNSCVAHRPSPSGNRMHNITFVNIKSFKREPAGITFYSKISPCWMTLKPVITQIKS